MDLVSGDFLVLQVDGLGLGQRPTEIALGRERRPMGRGYSSPELPFLASRDPQAWAPGHEVRGDAARWACT